MNETMKRGATMRICTGMERMKRNSLFIFVLAWIVCAMTMIAPAAVQAYTDWYGSHEINTDSNWASILNNWGDVTVSSGTTSFISLWGFPELAMLNNQAGAKWTNLSTMQFISTVFGGTYPAYLNNWGEFINRGTLNNNTYSFVTNNSGGTLTNSGTLTNNSGATLNNSGTITNYGQWGLGPTINYGTLTNYGMAGTPNLINYSGAELTNYAEFGLGGGTNYGTVTNYGNIGIGGLNNYGTLTNSSGATLDNYGWLHNLNTLTNAGSIIGTGEYHQSGGETRNYGSMSQHNVYIWGGALTNYAGATLNTGELYDYEGTLYPSGRLQNYGTITNYAGATLNNYAESVDNSGTLNNYGTLDNSSTLINAGSIAGWDVYTLGVYTQTAGQTTNTGSISQASIDIQGGTFNQQAGSLTAPSISNSGAFNYSGGSLNVDSFNNTGVFRGAGTINPLNDSAVVFTNTGILAPGNSPGTLNITGNYTQETDGTLEIDLGKSAYDILNVTGTASLAGILQVLLYGDYVPANGSSFDFLTASNGITGNFDSIKGPSGWIWNLTYLDLVGVDGKIDTARLTANAVPVPAAVWLLGSGLLGIIGIRRKWGNRGAKS